MRLIFFAT